MVALSESTWIEKYANLIHFVHTIHCDGDGFDVLPHAYGMNVVRLSNLSELKCNYCFENPSELLDVDLGLMTNHNC